MKSTENIKLQKKGRKSNISLNSVARICVSLVSSCKNDIIELQCLSFLLFVGTPILLDC